MMADRRTEGETLRVPRIAHDSLGPSDNVHEVHYVRSLQVRDTGKYSGHCRDSCFRRAESAKHGISHGQVTDRMISTTDPILALGEHSSIQLY